jgi:hypothetical protein
MRLHWRLILPCLGLLLFGLGSYESLRNNREAHRVPSRYFWWSSIRLDSDPLGRNVQIATPCQNPDSVCIGWDPVSIWVDPGWLAKVLMASALPAFVIGALIVGGLGRLGTNEVWSFMLSMPILICGWYYLVGWLLDRWAFRHTQEIRS